jgi:hypothetical protein
VFGLAQEIFDIVSIVAEEDSPVLKLVEIFLGVTN